MSAKKTRVFVMNVDRITIVSAIFNLEDEGYLGYGETAEDNLLFQLAYRDFVAVKENEQKLKDFYAKYRLRLVHVEYQLIKGKKEIPTAILFYCMTKDESRIKAKITLTKEKMEVIDCDEESPANLQENYL